MKVLLAHSNLLINDPKQMRKMRPFPPLGTLYAAALLRESGFTVDLFDPVFLDSTDSLTQKFEAFKPDIFIVYEDLFNYITKMCLEGMRNTANNMCRAAARFGAAVIAAGPDMTDHPEIYFENGADYVLSGEPDDAVNALCTAIGDNTLDQIPHIHGVIYQNEAGENCRAPDRKPEVDLDAIPLPAWDLVDMDSYRTAWMDHHGYFTLIMVTSRGCPFRCHWCAKPIWGINYAQRSPENVVEELKLLKENYAPDHIWFADDLFGYTDVWLSDFSRRVIQNDAVVPFTIQTRVDLLNETAVAQLEEAGCHEIWVGVESGSQKVLNAMNKGFELETVYKTAKRMKATGMRLCFFIQFGYPGEKLNEIRDTVKMIQTIIPDDIGISVSYPLPGTELFELMREHLEEKSQWDNSDDLAMLYPGAYITDFYRMLHDVLHEDLKFRHRIQEEGGPEMQTKLDALSALTDAWFALGISEAQNRSVQSEPEHD